MSHTVKEENLQTEEEQQAAPKYWRSIDELKGSPDFDKWLHREFPENASVADEGDRRSFLKLMGASMGLAGLGMSGCRLPKEYVLPYAKQPENMVPGVPIYYASSWPAGKDSIPLVVETHDARPTKLEGNPSYKGYGGATNSYAQASVLDLYDPDRAQKSHNKSGKITRGAAVDVLSAASKKFQAKQGKGLAILAEKSSSPTRLALVNALKKAMPQAIWAEYEPVDADSSERALTSLLGKPSRAVYQLSGAKRVLALDSDFINAESGHLKFARDFAKARKVTTPEEAPNMNRLYAVESDFTLTGAMADHRLRASTSHVFGVAALVAIEVLKQSGGNGALVKALEKKADGFQADKKWIAECAQDLFAHKKHSLVIAGAHLPESVHALVFLINQALQAEGNTVDYVALPANPAASISDLAQAAQAGAVEELFILGGNPAYNAPADIEWSSVVQKVTGQVVRYGYFDDESAADADVFIAATHFLESWADGRTFDGTYVPVQPMILPLYEGIGEIEAVAHLAGLPASDSQGYELVRSTFDGLCKAADKETAFRAWLTEGVLEDSAYASVNTGSVKPAATLSLIDKSTFTASTLSASNLEFRLTPSSHTFDGRYANNGWLMELPDPMNKLTWDNAICVSPKLAKELNQLPEPIQMDRLGELRMNANQFKRGQEIAPILELTVNGKTISGPMHIQPGLADYTVVLPLGFGRSKVGRAGTDPASKEGEGFGYSAYPFLTTASPSVAVGGSVKLAGKTYRLANTQEHWSMEGRAIIREGNNEEFVKDSGFVHKMGAEAHSPAIYGINQEDPLAKKSTEIPRGGSAYKTPEFTDEQQWGMHIDLNTCTACNSCVVACQSENNIPIVGKDQVLRGRELHWIRLDRYYSHGDSVATTDIPEDPQVSFMGVACMHCELAPCESVCPVNATVHDEQGLNTMAYNRCVGTRYCANNCPYKVRRFNFFDYNKRDVNELYKGPLGKENDVSTTQMQKNPDVTVRMRGVMEKCTFCVQRIEEAKINQRNKAKDSANVNVPDGTIKTACQQVCPTDAISFGDVADATTEVSQAKESELNYSLLGYLNVRPRTTYSAKLRNPNPALSTSQPLSRVEYENRYGHSKHAGAHGEEHGSSEDAHHEHSHDGDHGNH